MGIFASFVFFRRVSFLVLKCDSVATAPFGRNSRGSSVRQLWPPAITAMRGRRAYSPALLWMWPNAAGLEVMRRRAGAPRCTSQLRATARARAVTRHATRGGRGRHSRHRSARNTKRAHPYMRGASFPGCGTTDSSDPPTPSRHAADPGMANDSASLKSKTPIERRVFGV